MTQTSFFISFSVAYLLFEATYSYSTGPPSAACKPHSNPKRNVNMRPGHRGIDLETDPTLTKAKIDVQIVEDQEDILKITVSYTEQFKGRF